MEIHGSVALVTGSNRGLGRGFVLALLERGACKVYATARDPAGLQSLVSVDPARVVPLQLDVTRDEQITATVQRCGDLSLLINNGGVAAISGFLNAPSLDGARAAAHACHECVLGSHRIGHVDRNARSEDLRSNTCSQLSDCTRRWAARAVPRFQVATDA